MTKNRTHQISSDERPRLRFSTAGSVDDGKSTLIGRLLYDTKSLLSDQLEALDRASKRLGSGLDLASLTDGLRAEREQGITIDVAYRYFATPGRRFIVADSPGHAQYTRNMVTATSNADLTLVLVDARHGVTEQTRRHVTIAAKLRVPVVVGVNKMDLVDWDESVFLRIAADLHALGTRVDVTLVAVMPLSALLGDNVVESSGNTPWYAGPPLLKLLEEFPARTYAVDRPARLPVQWILRDPPDFRGYSGMVHGGTLTVGEEVVILPSGRTSKISGIHTFDGELESAHSGQNVTVLLEDQVDVSRGDVIAPVHRAPTLAHEVDVFLCWMVDEPLRVRRRVEVQHTTRSVRGMVTALHDRLDVQTLEPVGGATSFELNDMGRVRLRLQHPIVPTTYAQDRELGGLILIDPETHDTLAAGLIEQFTE